MNTVSTLGPLIFDCQHVSDYRIVWGVSLEPGRIGQLPPRLVGLASGFTFYQFGIMASGLLLFPFFFVCLLVEWQEVKKRLPPARRVAGEGLPGGHLLQVASSPPCLWRS